jgi:lipopolysaccharide/colanic/teichoic acid biosynthesis glycosyltransferase
LHGRAFVSYPGRQVSGVVHRGGGGAEALRVVTKRAIDVFVAFSALVVLSPLFLLLAVLIVLDSRGPVFYRAERVGFRGEPLAMLKFRKMHRTAAGASMTTASRGSDGGSHARSSTSCRSCGTCCAGR